ncbi:MAG: hypothetical protein JW981_02125 [Anaerolineae bacterium]|nr:hypothetical protein [Anaerolineae bacterium]
MMKRYSISLSYLLRTFKLDHIWLSAGLWGLFAILVILMQDDPTISGPTARGFLGVTLPLLGGVMAAHSILDDPALELLFATPLPAWLTLAARLGLVLVVVSVAALTFQGYLVCMDVTLNSLGNLALRQLAWLVPTTVLMALGCVMAFASANSTAGSLVVGGVWIFELLARGWFVQDRWARYFFVFMGALNAEHSVLRANQIFLAGLALVFLIAAWALLKKQERYIK